MAATQTADTPAKRKVVPMKPKSGTSATPTKAKAKAADTPSDAKSKGPKRYIGKTSGLRVQEFQTKTLQDNFKAKLTDEQVAKLWRDEFPLAVKFSDKTVKAVRVRFNKGIHGGQDGKTPDRVSRPFDADGKELPLRGEGGMKATAKTAEPKTAPVAAKKKISVKRKG